MASNEMQLSSMGVRLSSQAKIFFLHDYVGTMPQLFTKKKSHFTIPLNNSTLLTAAKILKHPVNQQE